MPSSKKLYLTASAVKDLKAIAEYTQQRWGTNQKKKYITQIKDSLHKLCINISLGKRRDDIDKGLYSYLNQKHVIFYCKTTIEVQIIRILHQSMDIEAKFLENK